MNKTQKAMNLALEALEYISSHYMSLPKIGCMALAAIEEALAEQETVLPGGGHVPAVPVAVYGYCPECGGAGVMRERRPNGDDKCTNGHKYPSSKALAEQPAQPHKGMADYINQVTNGRVKIDPVTGDVSFGTLFPQPAQQQEPVARVIDDGTPEGSTEWIPFANRMEPLEAGDLLYTSPQPARQHQCSRSHPHENMDAMCELRTEIARLTNENARLKARHQDDEINAYRMTLLCIRDGLQQGMSKSIQKLQAREINDVLGLPSFASYRTSPPASKPWVGLTDEEIEDAWPFVWRKHESVRHFAIYHAIEAKLREKNA